MPIFVGTSDIDDITLGGATTGFHSVWKGSTRVWARPLLYDLNVAIYDPTPHYAVTLYGYDSLRGSIDFVSGHNQYTSDWFKSSGGQSHSQYIYQLQYYDYDSSQNNTIDYLRLTIGSTNTAAQSIPNTDATFKRLTVDDGVNNYVFNRSAASYSYSTGSNYTTWLWYYVYNPFSGVSDGTDVKIRFDKP